MSTLTSCLSPPAAEPARLMRHSSLILILLIVAVHLMARSDNSATPTLARHASEGRQRSVLALAGAPGGCCNISAAGRTRPQPVPSADGTVRLLVDYGGKAKAKQFDVAWREPMTVLDAMKAVAKRPAGLRFAYTGSGATALLTSIDEVKNEGSKGRNWIYRVNGKLADRSFGIFRLKSGDTVRWQFSKYKW